MKSQNDTLLHVLCNGVLTDAKEQIPGLRLDRDIQTLTRLVEKRGVGVFLLDLPSLDTVLTTALENGRLTLGSPLTRAYSKRVKLPRLFSGIWKRIFHNDGALRSDPCVDSIFFLRQISCLYKKYEIPCSNQRKDKSYHDYIKTDKELRQPTHSWAGCRPFDIDTVNSLSFHNFVDDTGLPVFNAEYDIASRTNQRQSLLLSRLQRVCDSMAKTIGTYFPICFAHIGQVRTGGASGLRHGPGAVSVNGHIEKYAFMNWQPGLRQCFPYDMMVHDPQRKTKITNRSDPSRLIAVPKTAKAPRLIAAEPVENQFCQQMTWGFLRQRIRETVLNSFIDFSRQDLSGELVITSSLSRELSTVDLSSASDRLSCFVIERAFRKNPSLLSAFHSHRSRFIKMPSGDLMFLNKFASQGAAVTFPVQSLVFLCAVFAACGVSDISKTKHLRGKVRVFGDDIIVPTCHLEDLKLILTALQLKVNDEKSFSKGHFRESCGFDYFKGFNITPNKPKALDSTTVSGRLALLDQINNFFESGLWKTSDVLKGLLGKGFENSLPVNNLSLSPPRLRSFVGYDYSHLKMRWNHKLHLVEYKVRSFYPKEPTSNLEGDLGLRAFFNERKDDKRFPGYHSSLSRSRTGDRYGWVAYPSSPKAKLGRFGF